ncbi:MAG: hypothetical protein GF370_03795, partial [Candidatus Nealsonbacteria bacterium]|nr:hypothetical protein [Candidatus Nealsonbacteria bacterium]
MNSEFLIIIPSLLNLFLGFAVFRRGENKSLNKIFLLFSLSVFAWSVALFFYSNPIILNALIWIKLTYVLSICVLATGFYFVSLFSGVKKEITSKLLKFFLALITPLVFILFCTDWWVKEVILTPRGYHTITGPVYAFFGLVVGVYSFLTFYFLFQEYRKASGIKKLQLKYIFLGITLFGIPAFILDVALPLLLGISEYFWISPVFAVFFTLF